MCSWMKKIDIELCTRHNNINKCIMILWEFQLLHNYDFQKTIIYAQKF